MSDGRNVPEPGELVYVPPLSWGPVLAAVGLAGLAIGLYAGLVYAIVAAIVLIAAVRTWIRQSSVEVTRLPRQQRITSAVLPAAPLRRSGSGDE